WIEHIVSAEAQIFPVLCVLDVYLEGVVSALDVLQIGHLAHDAERGCFATRTKPILRMPVAPVFGAGLVRTILMPNGPEMGWDLVEAVHLEIDPGSIEAVEIKNVRPPVIKPTIANTKIMWEVSEPPLMVRCTAELEGVMSFG